MNKTKRKVNIFLFDNRVQTSMSFDFVHFERLETDVITFFFAFFLCLEKMLEKYW